LIGVGGSAANCSHPVNDFRKLCGIETYRPFDNVSELTARTNDEGCDTASWLDSSHLGDRNAIVIYSVGGGGTERKISANIVHAIVLAKAHSAKVFDIVGRDSGYAAKHYDLVLAHRRGQSELVIRGFPGRGLALPGQPSSLAA
jgi:D-sedoheptulose 7-phosphate isomerase